MSSPDRTSSPSTRARSATKAVLVDAARRDRRPRLARPSRCTHPRPGWVEQDADEIWAERPGRGRRLPRRGTGASPRSASAPSASRCCCGTARTGEPLGPMLSWQDQRTAPTARRCASTPSDGPRAQRAAAGPDVLAPRRRAGCSTPTARDERRASARSTPSCCTSSAASHVIEAGNAARTQLLDVRARDWSPELLELFGVPREVLPRGRRVAPARSRPPAASRRCRTARPSAR